MSKLTETVKPGVRNAAPLPRLDHCRVLVLFGGGRMFGSELGNLEVFRQMAKLGLTPRFITSSKFGHREIQPELDRLGFEWATAPFGYHWGKYLLGRYFYYLFFNLYGVVATSWRVWREVRRWKPTHLYCMNWLFFIYAMPALLRCRLPLVYRAGDEFPTHTSFHRRLASYLFRRVEAMVCISHYILERCAGAGMSLSRMRVIHNYPPARADKSSVPPPEVPQGAVVLTYLGQVSEHKGVIVLVEAFEQLIKFRRNIVLWVAGEPGWGDRLLEVLRQRAEAAGLKERIRFFGYVSNVYPLLARSDVHVCPSLSAEALSNVVGEAKLCGKPSVVFPSGGLPELIEHGVDGYVCREKTVEGLVEGIEFFLNDPERRRLAGEAARRSLEEKFGEERFCRAWAEVFQATTPQNKAG